MAKIMLVEDDNNLREIYEARLQAEGYTIVSAQDGEEALVIAKKEQPDLVISDVMMPKISGFEMLDILRNTEGLKDVKVIMLTALGQNDDQQRADRLGANRYLVKSQVTLEDIVRVAQELLSGEAPTAEPVVTETPAPTPLAQATPDTPPETDPDMPVVEPAGIAAQPLEITEPVAAEPVASAPVPDAPAVATSSLTDPATTATSAPEPVVADEQSSATAPPTATVDTDDTQSTSSEKATVAAQIDSFVSTAPATTPVQELPASESQAETEAAAAAPEPAQAPTVTPELPVTTAESTQPAVASEADPAVTAENSLTALLNQNAVESPETPTTTLPAAEPAVAEQVPSPAVGHTGGNRIISPIDSEPKPNLSELVALENAKEVATGAAHAPVVSSPSSPVAAPTPQAPLSNAAPAAPGSAVDPNSISL